MAAGCLVQLLLGVVGSTQDVVPCGGAGAAGDVAGWATVCWAAPGSRHRPGHEAAAPHGAILLWLILTT